MNHVDLVFPVRGTTLKLDHGYGLYAALSHHLPALHKADWLAVHPIGGRPLGRDELALNERSAVTLRLPADRIPTVLPLAGRTLTVHGASLVLGVPTVRALQPAASLDARLVIIKLTRAPEKEDGTMDVAALRERFAAELRRQLDALGIARPFEISGRRSLSVRDRRVIGFSTRVRDLAPDESIRLQIEGVGGKRAMGAGVFRPTRGGTSS